MANAALRAFHRPRLWLAAWVLMIAAVIVLSLMPKPPIPPGLTVGKFDHLIAYIALAAMAVQLYRQRRAQMYAAWAMIALGIALELAQGFLTDYRDMSAYDAMIDAIGVAIGFATTWTPLATILLHIDARLPR